MSAKSQDSKNGKSQSVMLSGILLLENVLFQYVKLCKIDIEYLCIFCLLLCTRLEHAFDNAPTHAKFRFKEEFTCRFLLLVTWDYVV